MSKAGMRLPIESHVLQAFVSEGLKPVLPGVITFGAGHFYVSQSDKGGLVFGGDIDGMWGGIMDMSMDGSPIIDRTHIDGLYFNMIDEKGMGNQPNLH